MREVRHFSFRHAPETDSQYCDRYLCSRCPPPMRDSISLLPSPILGSANARLSVRDCDAAQAILITHQMDVHVQMRAGTRWYIDRSPV